MFTHTRTYTAATAAGGGLEQTASNLLVPPAAMPATGGRPSGRQRAVQRHTHACACTTGWVSKKSACSCRWRAGATSAGGASCTMIVCAHACARVHRPTVAPPSGPGRVSSAPPVPSLPQSPCTEPPELAFARVGRLNPSEQHAVGQSMESRAEMVWAEGAGAEGMHASAATLRTPLRSARHAISCERIAQRVPGQRAR